MTQHRVVQDESCNHEDRGDGVCACGRYTYKQWVESGSGVVHRYRTYREDETGLRRVENIENVVAEAQ